MALLTYDSGDPKSLQAVAYARWADGICPIYSPGFAGELRNAYIVCQASP